MSVIHDDNFIGGRWQRAHSDRRTAIVNPATEQIWAKVPDGDAVDIDRAVVAARAALPGWRSSTPDQRAELIRALADALDTMADEFTRLITTENGTPVAESSVAAGHGAAHLRIIADLAGELTREDVRPNPLAPGQSIVERSALGVAGLITPWNFPLSLIIIKLGPALLAGCTVVVKPAPETPMAAPGFPPSALARVPLLGCDLDRVAAVRM